MIKLIAAALWIVAVTLGAVFFSFQMKAEGPETKEQKAMLGGLDYIKTDVISVPLLKGERIAGYFLTRLVYTADPKAIAKMSVPAEALISDQVYTYLYGNPLIDFTAYDQLDLDAFRNGIRDSINARVGELMVHEVLVEQIDFLTPDDVRDKSIRRNASSSTAPEPAAAPAH